MPTATIMVGLPATGKSTLINKIKHDGVWIYSTDMFIESVAEDNGITYDEAFESNIDAAKQFNDRKLASMIKLGKDVIFDQTNLGVGKRKQIVARMKSEGYTVNCICIKPPESKQDIAEHVRRLHNRPGKNIPNFVISNMMESFVLPTAEEGYDSLHVVDMYGDTISLTGKAHV